MSTPSEVPSPHRHSPGPVRPVGARVLTSLVWAALLLAPVLLLVETTGPRWLNLTLRGFWVAVVMAVAGLLVQSRTRTRHRDGVVG